MDRKELIDMAEQAGGETQRRTIFPPTFQRSIEFTVDALDRFAALRAAKERDACANVCTSQLINDPCRGEDEAFNNGVTACLNAIRQRGEK